MDSYSDREHGEPSDAYIAQLGERADDSIITILRRQRAQHLWHPQESEFVRNNEGFLSKTREALVNEGWSQEAAAIEAKKRQLILLEAERMVAREIGMNYIAQKTNPNRPRNHIDKKQVMSLVALHGDLLDPAWYIAIDETLVGEPLDLANREADPIFQATQRRVAGAQPVVWLENIVCKKPSGFAQASKAEQEVWEVFVRVMIVGPLAMHVQKIETQGTRTLSEADAALRDRVRIGLITEDQANQISAHFRRLAEQADATKRHRG